MKGILAVFALTFSLAGIAGAQGMMSMDPPKEMQAVSFLSGDHKGSVNFYFGRQRTPSTCSSNGEKTLNDHFLELKITYAMQGMTMQGMHLLTYDPVAKQYVGWWFDSSASNAMHLTGNFVGDKLVLVSDPTKVDGVGTMIMRSSWWKKGDSIGFSLESKDGDKWTPMMDGDLKKG
jgi:hypothetical protein